ncbi:MAG: Tim44/TimA family putative adaptor protein [Pseudomonadota bacterium]
MSQTTIEFLLLAAIAIFIGWRLYVTLGQDSGPPEGRQRVQTPPPGADKPKTAYEDNVTPLKPTFSGPAADGLESIYDADQSFNPRDFVGGAKAAYEMIVAAFARGDRTALQPLLDTDVYEAWDAAITEREANGQEGMQLMRLRKAEITDASLDETRMARVTVHFQSELSDGEMNHRASEYWTFMRQVDSDNPNWLLDDVDTAA